MQKRVSYYYKASCQTVGMDHHNDQEEILKHLGIVAISCREQY